MQAWSTYLKVYCTVPKAARKINKIILNQNHYWESSPVIFVLILGKEHKIKRMRKIRWSEKKGKKSYATFSALNGMFSHGKTNFSNSSPHFFLQTRTLYIILSHRNKVQKGYYQNITQNRIFHLILSLYDTGMKEHNSRSLNNKAVHYCTIHL